MSFKSDVFADYEAAVRHTRKPTWGQVFLKFFRYSGFRVAVLYRLGHWARGRGMRVLGGLMARLIFRSGVSLSPDAEIGGGLLIPHPFGIVIGTRTRIGRRAYILQGATLGGRAGRKRGEQSQPHVGDDVLIGAGAKLMGPIRVGDRVTIGANAVVTTDLPDDCTAVGIPARIVKLQGKRVGLLQQTGELPKLLNQILDKLNDLEKRIHSGTGPA